VTPFLNTFAPFAPLAEALSPWLSDSGDGSHDLTHVARVWNFVRRLQSCEGGDLQILFAATFLHDCVHVEKNHPDRHVASRRSATRAAVALTEQGWAKDRVAEMYHAIEAHSLSAGMTPRTIEARILQDADRLDATGLVGIARCFYVAGRIGSALYDAADPTGHYREYDDMAYALDHFETRLLCDTADFQTATARYLADHRVRLIAQFRDQFLREVRDPSLLWLKDREKSA
jgi:uncharacterized protein